MYDDDDDDDELAISLTVVSDIANIAIELLISEFSRIANMNNSNCRYR